MPMGSICLDGGVNFAFYSKNADAVELLLYEKHDEPEADYIITLEPCRWKTGDIWHVFVKGAGAGWCYNIRVSGPWNPSEGLRFNRNRVLVDPWARAFTNVSAWDVELAADAIRRGDGTEESMLEQDNSARAARAIVIREEGRNCLRKPDWKRPMNETVIYETHVRGLTIHPSSGTRRPGTYAGLVEKIPYLKGLGVTAVELLPIQEFNENDILRTMPGTEKRLRNYWGYSTVGFFAPKEGYAASRIPGGQVREFREMVDCLHEAGLEVILDVVFNHTGEGDETGPVLHMKGQENSVWYMLEEGRMEKYKNFSGCGNTMNCSHPVAASFILECLRYWAVEMGVDGFRFDLASILCRGRDGKLLENPPLVEMITEDPVLGDVKLIAEAWDASGAWQVGSFPGGRRWADWNGVYRDDVRRFWRGEPFMAPALASRICGSEDIYRPNGKGPANSINFITCHDGFTLNDLVSYSEKHNEMNGEEGRDGTDLNYSFNCGAEGPSDDPAIVRLRARQVRNLMATLFLSKGVPMISGGDEILRTQQGNNNAYCQDNEISWYDWNLFEKNRWFYRFVAGLAEIRRHYPRLFEDRFYTREEITWFDNHGRAKDWNSPDNILGAFISGDKAGPSLCLLVNGMDRDVTFSVPGRDATGTISRLKTILDTAIPVETGKRPAGQHLILSDRGCFECDIVSRSLVLFEAEREPAQ
jgi:glycogen operon protein